MDYTITGSYKLPSLGKLYSGNVKAEFSLRSMTVADEMKRLNPSDRPYKVFADIIDDCMVDSPGISAYDMCMGDYQYCLFKLREITYGNQYKLSSVCPYCGFENDGEIKLNEFEVNEFTDDVLDYFNEIELPVCKKTVTLKMQTPRMLDNITVQVKELKKKMKTASDPTLSLTMQALIDTVDGVKIDAIKKEDFVRSLPLKDGYKITKASDKFNERIGLKTELTTTCDLCGLDYNSPFRFSAEFFRPEEDE